jgi:hypothetical protein
MASANVACGSKGNDGDHAAEVPAAAGLPRTADPLWLTPGMAVAGRYCCKSLFALLIKNSLGCVKMWGTSSPDRKLTGDLGNAIESTEIDGRRSRRPLAEKLSPGDFRLLQQYRPIAEIKIA